MDQVSAIGTIQMLSKDFEQIADIPDSYLAIAGIETGYGARIPLWMFGLLY